MSTDLDKAREIAFLQGQYEMCRTLLTSPRFNKTQQEVIREIALSRKADLEALGVDFLGGSA